MRVAKMSTASSTKMIALPTPLRLSGEPVRRRSQLDEDINGALRSGLPG